MIWLVVKLIDGESDRYDAMEYDFQSAVQLYRSQSVGDISIQSATTKEMAITKGLLQFNQKLITTKIVPHHQSGYLLETNREAIIEALRSHGWRQDLAAKALGITPRSLNYKIQILKIVPPFGKWRRGRKVNLARVVEMRVACTK
jgi:DNA-binding NtrC family response regulator